jgi:ABC-type transport system involved in multi-copper enzyme maturation permease subunit
LEEITVTMAGPLVAVEAWRAVSSDRVRVLRRLVPIGAGLALLLIFCAWWLATQQPTASPASIWQTGLEILLIVMTTGVWLLAPALLAGAFSGERAQPGLLLLLTCHVTSREIVLGRLLGRLAVCGALFLPAVPALVFLAAFCDLHSLDIALILLLPPVVAFGAGGMCCALSVVSRKGRDALLAVYLFDALVVLAPVFAEAYGATSLQWVMILDPYGTIGLLVAGSGRLRALLTIASWLLIGVTGVGLAARRLRASATRVMVGERASRLGWRPRRVPPIGNRPMLWKEMHIEQMRTVSRIARWLGIVLVVTYLIGHLWLGGRLILDSISQPDIDMTWWPMKAAMYASFARKANPLMAWVLELAVGLRAASAIASERERNTWDLILTSPLRSKEIMFAKLAGSLYALRMLFLIFIIGWVLPVAAGLLDKPWGIAGTDVVGSVLSAVAVCLFMVVCGVAVSLANDSTAKAMTWIVAAWVLSQIGANLFATVAGMGTVFALSDWVPVPPPGSMTPGSGSQTIYSVVSNAVYAIIFLMLSFLEWWRCRRRFDLLAGRTFASTIKRQQYQTLP